ncbi:hypothetical protein [Pseudonocardia spinosispora]|uniref:hypothetical protein n=1 Tax=Pseudonocardia spinosispora TaxID=103441 RepID=UPI00041F48D5|nr:hypothetical protein [Pseudonocardia spinosispora]
MNQANPDDDGRAADSSGCSTTFDDIVASWRAEGSVPSWPGADDSAGASTALADPTTGPADATGEPAVEQPPAAAPADPHPSGPATTGTPRAWSPAPEPDDDHYLPPEPPPMPHLGPPAVVGLALLSIGVVLLVAPEVFGLRSTAGLPLGLLSLALGLGWLVLRAWPSEKTDDEDDDGAVL